MQERAPAAAVSPRQLAADLAAAFLFSTRLPLPGVSALTGADIARAGWALPVAGAIVGLISALVYWLARASGLPPLPAALDCGAIVRNSIRELLVTTCAVRPSAKTKATSVFVAVRRFGQGRSDRRAMIWSARCELTANHATSSSSASARSRTSGQRAANTA